jgi:hypothetical protein
MARTGIGAAYVQRQMAQGRSMASIQQEAASKGYQIGAKAQAMFSGGGGGGGKAPAKSPAPAPAAAPARTGIGAAYVQREMAKGRSMASIQQEAKDKGYQIGAKAQAMFSSGGGQGAARWSGGKQVQNADWIHAANAAQTAGNHWLNAYTGSQGGSGSKGFGAAALQRARDAGHSDADIQKGISEGGYTLGGHAQTALGGGTSVQEVLKGQRNIWAHYNPGGGGGWGSAANTRALQAGMTRPEIISQLSESGLYIGDKAAQDLNVHTGQTPLKRPKHVEDKIGGYNTRYVLMPRDTTAEALNKSVDDPSRYMTGVYSTGGYSDAYTSNIFATGMDGDWDNGPHKHGTRGTYQDSDWDYNIGGGVGFDSERKNYYWQNADKEALASHDDSWRGHGYDGRTSTPTMGNKSSGELADATGWTAKHVAATSTPAASYDDTFRSAASDIAASTSSAPKSTPATPAEDSVLDKDGPVVEVIDKDPAPTNTIKSGPRDYNTAAGTGAPRNLASGISYYSQRFG